MSKNSAFPLYAYITATEVLQATTLNSLKFVTRQMVVTSTDSDCNHVASLHACKCSATARSAEAWALKEARKWLVSSRRLLLEYWSSFETS